MHRETNNILQKNKIHEIEKNKIPRPDLYIIIIISIIINSIIIIYYIHYYILIYLLSIY